MANTKISADQVEELLLKGKSHGGVLTYREIMDSMQNVEDMTPDDMDSMYELIAQKGIDVVDENSDDDVLPVNDDDTEEINEAELANLSVPEGVSIDDPVRMYLKEIGRVVYLQLSCEAVAERLGDLQERGVALKEGQTLRDLYEERTPLYEKYADITLNCEGKMIREVVAELVARLDGR